MSQETQKMYFNFFFHFRDFNISPRESGISSSSTVEASTPLNLVKDNNFVKKRKSPEELEHGHSSKRQKSFSINEDRTETEIDCTILDLRSRKSSEGKFRDLYRSDSAGDKLPISGIEKAKLHSKRLIELDAEKAACSRLPEGGPMDVNGAERILCIENSQQQQPEEEIKTCSDIGDTTEGDDSCLTEESVDYEDLLSDLEDEEMEEVVSWVSDSEVDGDVKNKEVQVDLTEDEETDLEMETETQAGENEAEVREKVRQKKIVNAETPSCHHAEDSGKGDSEDAEKAPVPKKLLCLSEEKLLAFKRKQVLKKINKLPISKRYVLHGRNLLPWKQQVHY